jgi:hypothetical protein
MRWYWGFMHHERNYHMWTYVFPYVFDADYVKKSTVATLGTGIEQWLKSLR